MGLVESTRTLNSDGLVSSRGCSWPENAVRQVLRGGEYGGAPLAQT